MTANVLRLGIAWAILACGLPQIHADDEDLSALEPSAFAAAVERVAPSVVRIETIGGREHVGQMLLGAGPTTGLIVDPTGYIVSSAFNFINQPASILVRLPDGMRKPAALVATDHSRMIVLLKIEVDKPLPVCEIAPQAEMRVGQWTIAVGRAFDSDSPNMAVGILSALDRIWGKAIQTDAAVSPNNYGGPLIDIRGRVLGVLVPLSPEAAEEVAGVEWYDSGIGFAVPVEQIQRGLARLKSGEDLWPGVAGIGIKGPNLFTGEPTIVTCRAKSPAAIAGIKPGDRIVEISGRKIARAAEVKEEIGRRYAGERMHVVVLRDGKQTACDVELVAKLEPYQHGFLGVLPMRNAVQGGVVVRYVYPESPAAKAGIVQGDVLLSLAGETIDGRLELRDQIGIHEPGEAIEMEFRHNDTTRTATVVLSSLPESLPPADLPPSHNTIEPEAGKQGAPVGAMPMKIPELANEAWVYVPRGCHEGVPHGVVLWLHGPGKFDWQELLARWRALCDHHDLILLAPKSNDAARWMPSELAVVGRLLVDVINKYPVDPTRVVVAGQESGGTLAFLAAFRNREVIRAVAAIDAAPVGHLPENEPLLRLAIYMAFASKSPQAQPIEAATAAMRKAKFPITIKLLGEAPRALSPEELAELVRWIDTLDRI